MRCYLIIIIALFIPAGVAQDSIFDILDEMYIIEISELPYSSGTPAIEWQKSGYIQAWIDVVGFRNLSREDNKYFIQGNPTDLAIIKYDATASPPGTVDCLSKTVTRSKSGNTITAHIYVKLLWHYYYSCNCKKDKKGKESCSTCRKDVTESATFTDSEIIPDQFDRIYEPRINITEYNNSVNPRTVIKLTLDSPAFINYTYNGDYISNYKMVARVESTSKGVYFANVSATNIWTTGTGSLRQMDDKVIIPMTADPDYRNLTIQVSNIYKTENVSKFTVVRDTYKFERSFSGLYISVIMIFSVLFGTLYYTAKRAIL